MLFHFLGQLRRTALRAKVLKPVLVAGIASLAKEVSISMATPLNIKTRMHFEMVVHICSLKKQRYFVFHVVLCFFILGSPWEDSSF